MNTGQSVQQQCSFLSKMPIYKLLHYLQVNITGYVIYT